MCATQTNTPARATIHTRARDNVSGACATYTYKPASLALPSLQHTHAQIHLSYVTSFTGAGGGADGTSVGLSRDRPHKRSPAVLSYYFEVRCVGSEEEWTLHFT